MLQEPRALGAELWILKSIDELATGGSTGQAFGHWEQGPEGSWPVEAVVSSA